MKLIAEHAIVNEEFLRDVDPRFVSVTLAGYTRLTIQYGDGTHVDVERGTPEWDRLVPSVPPEGPLGERGIVRTGKPSEFGWRTDCNPTLIDRS